MKRTEVTSVYQLFEAWSRPLLSGAGENIRWIPLRAERIRVAPYAVLIPDFDALSASEQSLAKGFVDEYFGLSEWNFLVAAFTGRDTLTIEARPVAFPLDCRDENGRIIRPLRCMEDLENRIVAECPFRPLPYGVLGVRLREAP